MKKLEDQATSSARSAESEKQHALQLEKDLKILAAELEKVKKESDEAKKAAEVWQRKMQHLCQLKQLPPKGILGNHSNIGRLGVLSHLKF